ncbi:MAG: phosphotransferase [Pseudomonadales bacterium]|nr:phosphotransferase [Pseudomonadales bacterium]MCP5184455.1 phosphotransferase [Pseudomonadales bacterium]
MTSQHFIPETPEQISPEWLNSVLAGSDLLGNNRVLAVSRRVLGDGEGFVGDILRLTLTLDDADGSERTLVAKLPKLANRAVGELLGAYERESMFFETLLPTLPVQTPRLYHGDFDRDRGSENQEPILRQMDRLPRFLSGIAVRLGRRIAAGKKRRYILLMEDVSDAAPGDQVAGANRERCRKILEDIAALHAAFWESDRLFNHFWLLPSDIDVNMRHGMMRDSRAAFEKLFGDTARRLTARLDRLETHGVATVRQLCRAPATLLHNDLRLDNLMFRGDTTIFIDWQLVRRGPAAFDVAYFLTSALDDGGSADDLLAHYHAALCRRGVSGYSLESLRTDYALALDMVLMGLATVDQMNMGDGRGKLLLETWMQRLANRLDVDGTRA